MPYITLLLLYFLLSAAGYSVVGILSLVGYLALRSGTSGAGTSAAGTSGAGTFTAGTSIGGAGWSIGKISSCGWNVWSDPPLSRSMCSLHVPVAVRMI